MAPTKIAILGGGVGALSAAFELTELDPGGAFEITVYQIGWRLGGKGAVGRDVDMRHRVEEHGLHVWTGFYDNAFNLVDRCYEALRDEGVPVPFGDRSKAFQGLDRVTLMQQDGNDWQPWSFQLPILPGTPGVFDSAPFVTLVDYVLGLAQLARDHHQGSAHLVSDGALSQAIAEMIDSAHALPGDPRDVSPRARRHLQQRLRRTTGALRGAQRARHAAALAGVAPVGSSPAEILIDLALAMAHGMLEDDVFDSGFDHLDAQEWSAWMLSNGCDPQSLDSGVARACYDYVFGYVGGNRRDFGAGTGTRLLLKLLLGYKGSFFYVMRATMGELLFAPLYRVLRQRKVRFEFFHRVDGLTLSADEKSIQQVAMTIQATTRGGVDYDPLIQIPDGANGSLDSWPSRPKYDLLNEGAHLRAGGFDLESAWCAWPGNNPNASRTLVRGQDFDEVVLGISLGAFPSICADLMARKPAWRAMVDNVRTVPTMALQLWTTRATTDLVRRSAGQPQVRVDAGEPATIVSSFEKPLDTWGDMSLLLGQETGAGPPPKGLHYFVTSFEPSTPVPPPGPAGAAFPALQLAHARQLQQKWVEQSLRKIWPGFVDQRGHVRWNLLFAPAKLHGGTRLGAQYSRVNINPSDQYVQSVTGSLFSRMTADGSGIDNLSLAGDWVRTGINAGCVESAVMAGRAAAGAIAGVEIDMPSSNDIAPDRSSGLVNAGLPALAALHKLEQAAAGGSGTIDAYCTVFAWATDEVKFWLPPGLNLADDKDATQDVVFVFARQRDVRPGPVPFGGLKYAEVFTIIPGVTIADSTFGGQLLFGFMPSLLVDHPVAALVGRNLYGFNKDLARIDHRDGSFDVRGRRGGVSAHFVAQGPPGSIGQFPEIGALRKGLQLPLVGQANDGSFVVSSVHWDLDRGSFQRVTGSILTGSPFTPRVGKIVLEAPLVAPPPAQAVAPPTPWGFRMNCQWRLSLPISDLGGPRVGDPNRQQMMIQFGRRVVGATKRRR